VSCSRTGAKARGDLIRLEEPTRGECHFTSLFSPVVFFPHLSLPVTESVFSDAPSFLFRAITYQVQTITPVEFA